MKPGKTMKLVLALAACSIAAILTAIFVSLRIANLRAENQRFQAEIGEWQKRVAEQSRAASASGTGQTDEVDEYIQVEMRKRNIPGLSLAVIQNGDLVKIQGYGFANLEHDVPVTPDTVF